MKTEGFRGKEVFSKTGCDLFYVTFLYFFFFFFKAKGFIRESYNLILVWISYAPKLGLNSNFPKFIHALYIKRDAETKDREGCCVREVPDTYRQIQRC